MYKVVAVAGLCGSYTYTGADAIGYYTTGYAYGKITGGSATIPSFQFAISNSPRLTFFHESDIGVSSSHLVSYLASVVSKVMFLYAVYDESTPGSPFNIQSSLAVKR